MRNIERIFAQQATQTAAPPAAAFAASMQLPAATESRGLRISPVARRLMEVPGVDAAAVALWNPALAHIDREEVEQYVRARLAASVAPPASIQTAAPATGTPAARRVGMNSVRRTIAQRMHASHMQTAPVTLTTKADATDFVAIRTVFRQAGNGATPPSISAMLAKIVATALAEHPMLNASLEGDEIVQWEAIHIGMAVDTEKGLMVPLVRNVQAKSLRQLTTEYAAAVERARNDRSAPDELRGGTFTITNLGAQEIDAFTPVINTPESAILSVGRIVDECVPRNGQATIRSMVALSLTFDHRIVDGGPAARFLQRIKQLIEFPALWLAG